MKQAYQKTIDSLGGGFTVAEFEPNQGADIRQTKDDLIENVVLFRNFHGYPSLLTSVFRPGDDGAHGRGLAADMILFYKWLTDPLDPWELWRIATTWPFWGVGIYFDWTFIDKNGERQKAPGIHVDLLRGDQAKRPLRWFAKEIEGERRYFYQRPDNGLFYAAGIDGGRTLEYAIKEFNRKK